MKEEKMIKMAVREQLGAEGNAEALYEAIDRFHQKYPDARVMVTVERKKDGNLIGRCLKHARQHIQENPEYQIALGDGCTVGVCAVCGGDPEDIPLISLHNFIPMMELWRAGREVTPRDHSRQVDIELVTKVAEKFSANRH